VEQAVQRLVGDVGIQIERRREDYPAGGKKP
jgi:hypothetical protein